MQSIALDVRHLYRYAQNGLRQPNRGGAVADWSRMSRLYRLSFYPLEATRGREDFGYTNEVYWRVIANDCTDFRLGDCIGDTENRLYEVLKVRTFRGQQQMEVREIWRTA